MKSFTRNVLRLGVLLVLVALAWAGWSYWSRTNEKPIEQRYQFEDVTKGDLTQTVTANGTVNPVNLVNVGTQVSGTVRKLYVDFNDKVAAGQVLLELDPTTTQAAVEQSTGELASAQATLRLARADEMRMRELFGQEYVSRQELDKAVQAREAAQAAVRSAQGKLMRDRANLGFTVIKSPVAGVVVSREVDIGQTVAASFQTPTLFKIARDLSQMQIDSNVAEADIGKVREGQEVRFTVDAYADRRFEGKVRQIRLAPITQQNVVTYNVVVEVSNPDLALLPGMTAYLSIVTDEAHDVVLVPNAALRFKPNEVKASEARAGAANGAAGGDARRREGANTGGDARPGGGSGAQGGGSAAQGTGAAGATPGGAPAGRGARQGPPRNPTVYVLRGKALVPVSIETGISDGRRTALTGGALEPGDRVAVEDLGSATAGATGGSKQPFRIRAF